MSGSTQQSAGAFGAGGRLYGWLAVVAVAFIVGLYGVVRLLTEGAVVLGITEQVPWGILISTYEFFLLMSAGVMIGVVAVALVFGVERFELVVARGVLLAFATLAAGLTTILVSLGRPERPIVQAVINANPSSAIWWVVVLAGAFGVVLLALLVLVDRDGTTSTGTMQAIAVLGLLLGIGVAVAAGMIFGTAGARPYYGGALAPVYFIVTGLLAGVAALALVVGVEQVTSAEGLDDDLRALQTESVGRILAVLLGATLVIALVKALYGLTATKDATALAYQEMLLGSFAPIYWGLGILVGLVVPLVLVATPRFRSVSGVTWAAVLALVGLFVTRYEFVVGGQVAALTPKSGYEYPIAGYAPSGIELAVVLFAFALCALVYTVGSMWLQPTEIPDRERMRSLTESMAETGGDDD
ncbi:MAG: NrfD/PsrC family molybdoenzyme membrane anchor subunit [Halobacteriota archaeon]